MIKINKILAVIIVLIAFCFSQRVEPLDITTINPENSTYDLDQKMSINMEDSDIKNVLMLIGELTGLNIVISPAVKDTITASLIDVSVKSALDAILKPNGYSYFVQENIIVVKDSQTQMVGELETVVVKLNYINSSDLIGTLGAVMTPRGKVQPFTPLVSNASTSSSSNIIVVSDIQENISSSISISSSEPNSQTANDFTSVDISVYNDEFHIVYLDYNDDIIYYRIIIEYILTN